MRSCGSSPMSCCWMISDDAVSARNEKDRRQTEGRAQPTKPRLSYRLMEEWAEHGKETLRIARVERPVEFAKMVAGLLPREFELEINTTITEISDDDLERFIIYCRNQIAAGSDARLINGREEPAPDRKQIAVLPALSETKTVS